MQCKTRRGIKEACSETERYPDCENCCHLPEGQLGAHMAAFNFVLACVLGVTMRLERGRWHGSLHGLGADWGLGVFPSPESVPGVSSMVSSMGPEFSNMVRDGTRGAGVKVGGWVGGDGLSEQ
jgi:hypothetical protein